MGARAQTLSQFWTLAVSERIVGDTHALLAQLAHERDGARRIVARDAVADDPNALFGERLDDEARQRALPVAAHLASSR